jgi:septal ring factor EnvC (AmiA/AmiB activator)
MTFSKITIFVWFAIFIGSIVHFPAFAQTDLTKKRSELEKLRKEIDRYEDKIKDRGKKEHATLELLDTYDKQASLLHKLINKLYSEEKSLQREIDESQRTISELGGQLSFLKRHYAKYVSTVYKYGRTYDLELLLSSRSMNQLLIRSEYIKRFSNQRKDDLTKIDTKRDNLTEQNRLYQKRLSEQRQLISEKKSEENKLAAKMKKRKTVLAEIRRDKKNYQREINRKVEAAKDLEQIIAHLIEADRVRSEREKELTKEGKAAPSARESIGGGTFQAKRGALRWPVSQGKVTARFGNQQHPVLKTVTQNPGIDISVPMGTGINAVADGEISAIQWLPSFGNLVIINHNNGFRTVYAHLSDIFISENQRVTEGERIGTSGESLAGPTLHFEIWKGREKQDPEQWLRPRGLVQR